VAESPTSDDRFDELAGLYLEGAATEKDIAELTELARATPERRRALARLLMQHGSLAWILRGAPGKQAVPRATGRFRAAWIAIPIAASLLVTALVIKYAPGGGAPSSADRAPRTLSFQDGVSPGASYSGTRDARLTDKDPSENRGADPILEVEGSSEPGGRPTLLRWDVREIPAGSEVVSAEVTITVTSVSRDRAYDVYACARPWVEEEVTWSRYAAGLPWEAPGGKGAADRGAMPLGRFTPKRGAVTFSLGEPGLRAVQSWVDRPAENYGIILLATERTGEFYAHSREAEPPAGRPKLTITYRPPAK
jgi:hypothetical protein